MLKNKVTIPSSDADEKPKQKYFWSGWPSGYIPATEERLNDEIKLISSELLNLLKKQKPMEKRRRDIEKAEKDAQSLQKQMDRINKVKQQLYAVIVDLREQMNKRSYLLHCIPLATTLNRKCVYVSFCDNVSKTVFVCLEPTRPTPVLW